MCVSVAAGRQTCETPMERCIRPPPSLSRQCPGSTAAANTPSVPSSCSMASSVECWLGAAVRIWPPRSPTARWELKDSLLVASTTLTITCTHTLPSQAGDPPKARLAKTGSERRDGREGGIVTSSSAMSAISMAAETLTQPPLAPTLSEIPWQHTSRAACSRRSCAPTSSHAAQPLSHDTVAGERGAASHGRVSVSALGVVERVDELGGDVLDVCEVGQPRMILKVPVVERPEERHQRVPAPTRVFVLSSVLCGEGAAPLTAPRASGRGSTATPRGSRRAPPDPCSSDRTGRSRRPQ